MTQGPLFYADLVNPWVPYEDSPSSGSLSNRRRRGGGGVGMLQLEENFDWPNSHYLNFVITNDFMCQKFLYQSIIKKLPVQES
jgi:hypothetical protein